MTVARVYLSYSLEFPGLLHPSHFWLGAEHMGRFTGRCGCKQDRNTQSQCFSYITNTCVCMLRSVRPSHTHKDSVERKKMMKIYLLTDVMNISAWPTLPPWCITAVGLSSLFSLIILRENPQICLRCIFHSPFHYLFRLIRAMVSAAAWLAKLCLIG